jgi:uncharacterized lipoprotein YmbA
MMGFSTGWCSALAVTLAVLLAGCAGQSPRTTFYLLSAEANPVAGTDSNCSSQAISVGPVSWPRYLDQPRIVTREGANRLEENEFNRWGGALDDGFIRTVIKNLSNLLHSDLVVNYRRSEQFTPIYRVEIIVNQFDGQADENVTLDATWSIHTEAANRLELVKNSSIQKYTSGPGYDALVNAYSLAVAQLSEEIAVQLDRLCTASTTR